MKVGHTRTPELNDINEQGEETRGEQQAGSLPDGLPLSWTMSRSVGQQSLIVMHAARQVRKWPE